MAKPKAVQRSGVPRKAGNGKSRRSAGGKPAATRSGSARKAGETFAGLRPSRVNFAPLTPISFLPRTAAIHPDRLAVVHGTQRFTYRQLEDRVRRLASALAPRAACAPAIPCRRCFRTCRRCCEAHFGVPMLGAVLNTINTRLDPATIAYILRTRRGEGADHRPRISPPRSARHWRRLKRPPLVDRRRRPALHRAWRRGSDKIEYEDFIATGRSGLRVADRPADESGRASRSTTPRAPPAIRRAWSITTAARSSKRVGNIMAWPLPPKPVYLWTLPMFHCNGWCFPWSVVAMGGTHVCLRQGRSGADLPDDRASMA